MTPKRTRGLAGSADESERTSRLLAGFFRHSSPVVPNAHPTLPDPRLGSPAMSLWAALAFTFLPPCHYSPRHSRERGCAMVGARPVRERTDRDNNGNERTSS